MSGTQQPDDYAERLGAFGLGHEDLRAWQDTGLPEEAFDGWLTDRVARRPAGAGPGGCTAPRRYTILPGGPSSMRSPSSQATGSWRSAAAGDCCSVTR